MYEQYTSDCVEIVIKNLHPNKKATESFLYVKAYAEAPSSVNEVDMALQLSIINM